MYKVITKKWSEEKDSKLVKVAVFHWEALGEHLSWADAKALKKSNPGSEIVKERA